MADDNSSMMEAFLVSFFNSFNLGSSSSAASTVVPNIADNPCRIISQQPRQSLMLLNQETLQHRLLTLIEGARENWTYAILWQSSVDISGASLLGWGDGYYKGGEEDKMTPASAVEQEHRKKVLRELNSFISGVPSSADDAVDEEVTDTEWFFLVSMAQSFVNGVGLPGQAFFSSSPVWLGGSERLSNSSCERAQQGQVFGLQTMVCIPCANGVVELGSKELIFQSSDLMNKVRVLFNFNNLEMGSWPSSLADPQTDQGVNDPSALWLSDTSSSVIEIKDSIENNKD